MMARVGVLLILCLTACSSAPPLPVTNLDLFGERFVHLALELGQYDEDYVDAYHGPEQWQRDAEAAPQSLSEIRKAASAAARTLRNAHMDLSASEQRRAHLAKQYAALAFRASMLEGKTYSFDEESRGLYDAVAPTHDAAYFQAALDELDRVLPGEGDVATRYQAYRDQFIVPPERLDEVFRTAIGECARRTREYIALPDNESFRIEYVTDKSWSGYNWFQGSANSLIQVNTDFPIYIDRAVDLACHEGYPGHHVYNTLIESQLLKRRGWIEFSILPLFSPTGLIAEGSANYGIRMAFPGDERVAYERETLFPLAGLNPATAGQYYQVQSLVARLSYAGNEAARRYLDGDIDGDEAADWLVRYALMAPDRARQRVGFFDQYRAYVINYNLGQDLVARYVEAAGNDPKARWERFALLLSSPVLPSQLDDL
ncbi:MAG: hypothetical protein AAFU65_13380 [Pseudomonadota bacterium]